jgi:hypothetical protein
VSVKPGRRNVPRPGGAVDAPDVVAAGVSTRCRPRPRWATGPSTTSNLLADSARMSRESSWGPTSAETVREIIETVEGQTRRCEREQRRKLVALARRALTSSHDAEHTGKEEVCRPAPRIAQSRALTRRDIPWPLDGHWMAVDS